MGPVIVGREGEQQRLLGLIESAAAGVAGSLLVVGEPGIGKTALLDSAAEVARGRGATVLRATAIEAESGINGSGLSSLLASVAPPSLGRPDTSPWALLSALSVLAEDGTVVAIVDDVHWLDDASTAALGFAARRLLADRVALIMAARPEVDQRPELVDVPRLPLGPLAEADAVRLLATASPATPPPVAADIARALGNVPLALLEAPALLGDDVLSGRVPVQPPVLVGTSVQQRYARGFAELPPGPRVALVLAAADDSGDLAVVTGALHRLGLDVADLLPAEASGLLILDAGVGFRHPLVRSAVFAAATAQERRDSHGALAAEFRGRGDVAQFARHAAAAAIGPDPDLADELERQARSLRVTSSAAAAAATAERAAALSADPADRWRRLVLAAELYPAGEQGSRRALEVFRSCGDGELKARAALVLADQDIFDVDAAVLLDEALAHRLPTPVRARAMASRIWLAMQEMDRGTMDRLAGLVLQGDPELAESWRLCFAIGSAYTFHGDHRNGVPWLRRAREVSDAIALDTIAIGDLFDWATVTGWLGEDPAAHRARVGAACVRWRGLGDPQLVASAELLSAEMARRDGLWERAIAHATAGRSLGTVIGTLHGSLGHRLAAVTAARGWRDQTLSVLADTDRVFELRGMAWERHWVDCIAGLLAVTLGETEEAITRLEPLREAPFLGRGCRDAVATGLALLIEAYVSAGRAADARAAAAELDHRLDGVVDRHGVALVNRGHAVAGTDDPEERYRSALAEHAGSDEPFEAARTRLLFGQWLRRTRRMTQAREHLRAATVVFERLRADPWTERARGEAAAAGDSRPAVRPAPAPTHELTSQELRVAMAVAEGLSNADIAASLFLSVKTVEFHLTRVYRKLGVRSRGGVARALAEGSSAA